MQTQLGKTDPKIVAQTPLCLHLGGEGGESSANDEN